MTDFITVIIISLGIIGPILAASNYMDSIAAMGTVVGEVCGILDEEELVRPMEKVKLKDLTIEMNQVTFSYHTDKKEMLHGITLKIRPGTVTALVGPSGSGKSTIAKLIAGFWDVGGGEITLGGCDLKKYRRTSLQIILPMYHRTIICLMIRCGKIYAWDGKVLQMPKWNRLQEMQAAMNLFGNWNRDMTPVLAAP